jgi:hydrogenase/urease accessory protein HupE
MMRLLLFCLALLSLAPSSVQADDNRPLTVTIVEEGRDLVRLTWKVPANVDQRHVPSLSAGSACNKAGKQRNWSDQIGHWREETWHCRAGIAGTSIAITYPIANPSLAAIVRYTRLGASDPQTLLLQPQNTDFVLENKDSGESSFGEFLLLGFKHIWTGFDHLLFVAGLIFVAGTPRRIVSTITGFTIAHSITLALSALDLVRLPTSAIEAVIALSIVFLAVEIVKGPRDTLTWRRPIAVAGAFGLLHGFGFAVVLKEVGLPEEGLVTALLAFNLGIELGQIAFAAAVLLLLRYGSRLTARLGISLPAARIAGYCVGTLASFWMFERYLGA